MNKFILITLILTINIIISAQSITMEVDNKYIDVGEWTTFTITASGDITRLEYNPSEGITINQIGRSTSLKNINGKTTKSYVFTYKAKADRPGDLELPQFYIVTTQGEKFETDTQIIHVEELKNDIIQNHDTNANFETDYVKLYIDIPKRNLYVGEAIPVLITAYFSTDERPGLTRAPYIKNGSFLLDTGDKENSEKPEKIINGKKWLQLTWDGYLTPLKAGNLDLQLAIDSYIVKNSNRNSFFSNTTQEDITTSTKNESIHILQLPLEGKPDDFTGAIGDFNISSRVSSTDIAVGDPITISIDLYGSGNFQRITLPKVNNNISDWKFYPETSEYEGSNGSNYKGVKQFHQILSPKNQSITETPLYSMSYFDPIKEKYKTLKTETIPINVREGVLTETEYITDSNEKFNEQKEVLRHRKKNNLSPYSSLTDNIFSMILIFSSILFILLSLVFIIIKQITANKNSDNIKVKSLIKEIEKLENDKNYIEALNIYKKIIINETVNNKTIDINAFTAKDIENSTFKTFFQALEEIKYTNNLIDQDHYMNITKDIKKEIKC